MCARTQFMTDSFLWADRPIMSKTNETMKHNASATAYYKRVISAICASMDEDIMAQLSRQKFDIFIMN